MASPDIRAGVALLIAALSAQGESESPTSTKLTAVTKTLKGA